MSKLPKVKPGERAVAIGGSGTGKTELIMRVLPTSGRLLVLDPKRMFDPDFLNLQIVDDPSKVGSKQRVLYRPKDSLLANIDAYDQVINRFYLKGNSTIYCDDLVGIMDRNRFPNSLRTAYMLGRSKKVTCIASVQRPGTLHDYDPDKIAEHRFSFQYNDTRFSEKSRFMRIALGKPG
jgi:ABC-type ATPase with predicted acetyltransferase domain